MIFRRVLFCPPTYFQVRDVKNPFMRPGAEMNQQLALLQWQAVRAAFEKAGFETVTIEAVLDLEDMVFANNQVFVGENEAGPFIVPSRMRFVSRQREVPYFVKWFRARDYSVFDLELAGDDYLEGHGDLLWQPDGSKVWAGYGIRSSKPGIKKFFAAMRDIAIDVIPLELVDQTFYHLDTCLAPLSADAVLTYPGAFSKDALRAIRDNVDRVYEVSREEALQFVCNGVAAGNYYITPRMAPSLERALAKEKLTGVVVDTSEFEKSGGSVCCLKLFIP